MNKIDNGANVASESGLKRSEHWPTLEHHIKKFFGPACQVCGAGPIQVHHWFPFHDCILAGRPELELTVENLFRLCETEPDQPTDDHHEIVGHLCDFKSYNEKLADSIVQWKGMHGGDIKTLDEYKAMATMKPLSYPNMSLDQQNAFRATIDAALPLDQITVFDGRVFRRNGQIVTLS